jgi:hypothetical protein
VETQLLRRIRRWLAVFIIGLVLSGVTAFPLQWELDVLHGLVQTTGIGHTLPDLARWIALVREGLHESYAKYPFLAYGTDWLAFAHLVIALAFIGPWRDPVRNVFVIEWAMWCCVAVLPLALIAGPLRGIPFYWRLIDCSFGVFGLLPLLLVRRDVERLAALKSAHVSAV